MSERLEGFVSVINTKTGSGKRGVWTLYSGKLENTDGKESDWISFGFDPPPFAKGDFISIEVEELNGRTNFITGTGRRPKNPPARKAKEVSTPSGKSISSMEGFNRQTNPIDAERMSYSSARSAAIDVVALLLAHNGLPITKAATGAAVAARFDEITAAIDKLTVQYTNDSLTSRVLKVVADAGLNRVDTKADGPIPEDKNGTTNESAAGGSAGAQDGDGQF